MNEKLLSVLSHGSVLCTSIFGAFGIPLLILLFGPSETVKQNAREALNVQINILLVSLLLAIFIVLVVTVMMMAGLATGGIQFDTIMNSVNDSIRIGPSFTDQQALDMINSIWKLGIAEAVMALLITLASLAYALWVTVFGFLLPIVAMCVVANDNRRVFRYPLMTAFLPSPNKSLQSI